MSRNGDSRAPQRRIDEAAKASFLAGLRRGERREDAAAAAGFSLMGFYGARWRDPAFKAEWTEALAASAAAERRPRPAREKGEIRIAAANRRLYQRRRRRNVRFTAERQAVFLAHFAVSGDTKASAEVAGVSESTVHLHRRMDPAFAEAYAQALAEAYVRLEAESLRLRLEAQKKLRAAIEAAGPAAPVAETDEEFDRIMKLLARWDRKPRGPDTRFKPGGRRHAWTFEEAIALLEKKMRALGIPIREEPPPDIRK